MSMDVVQVEPMRELVNTNMKTVRPFWISPLKRTVIEKVPTDTFTDQGQRIFKQGKVTEVAPIISLGNRSFQMPDIGERVAQPIPEHVFKQLAENCRFVDSGTKQIHEAFTFDEQYAQVVKRALETGKPVPKNFNQIAKNEVDSLTIEEMEEMLKARKEAEASNEKTSARSSTTKK